MVGSARSGELTLAHGVALMNDYYQKMETMLELMRHPIQGS